MTLYRKRIRLSLFLFFLSVFALNTSLRLEAQNEKLTLDQCISIALSENQLIRASMHEYQASLARINQAKAISQPTLNIDSDLQPDILDIRGSGESYVGIGKSLKFPGKRMVETAIATKESDEMIMETELLKLDIIYQVKLAFYGFILNNERLDYAGKNLELTQDFLDKTKVKFEAGDAAQVDVIRAQVEVAKATSEIKTISNEVVQTRADLNFLLGRNKNNPLEIEKDTESPFLLPDLEQLIGEAMVNRPEIKRINYALEKELLMKRLANLSYLPDFDLGFSKHTIVGESRTWDLTVALPIPIFFRQYSRGEVAEARANYQSLQSELEYLKNNIHLEVESAYRSAVTALNLISLFDRDMLNQSEEVYNLLLFSYQEGEISGIELIEARKTLIETRKSYAEALFEYEAANISIERSIGKMHENN